MMYDKQVEDKTAYFFEVYGALPRAGPGDDASTEKAFRMMNGVPEKPMILDIGCGPGKQTLALARISGGRIIALDNHRPFLERVEADARALGLSVRIKTVLQDMKTMDFAPGTFDVIWSEGALYQMGFAEGLRACRPLLKAGGSIGLTELVWLTDDRSDEAVKWAWDYADMKDVKDNLALFEACGYEVAGHFTLPASSWIDSYYGPMRARIRELRETFRDKPAAREVLDAAQAEIDGFQKCSTELGYEFFVARRTE